MNRIQEASHLESLFRQSDDLTKIMLVRRMRDLAVSELNTFIKKFAGAIPIEVRDGYERHNQGADEIAIFILSAGHKNILASFKCAAQLLVSCTEVLEDPSLFFQLKFTILAAYSGLENDQIFLGKKHFATQKDKAKKPRGKLPDGETFVTDLIRRLALNPAYSEQTAKQLWPQLHGALDDTGADPKEGVTGSGRHEYTFVDYAGREKSITFHHFANRVSEFRKNARH